MLEAIYRDNRYKVGLFSSPHLVDLGERVQVDRQILSKLEIIRYTEQLRTIAVELGKSDPNLYPTFFEFVAAMAFLKFARASVDIACIETGLGGRLDATNVVDPELSIITTISLDHCDILGYTYAAIAGEKAGIIKPGKPVLIGKLPPEADALVRRVAKERGCKLYSLVDRFSDEADLPRTNLAGGFQRWNAGLATYAIEILSKRFPVRSTTALEQVEWAGRWQTLEIDGRKLILDATHNPEGAATLKQNLSSLSEQPIIIAGTLGKDRARSLLAVVAQHARELYLVTPNQDRATSTSFLKSCLDRDAIETDLTTLFPKPGRCAVGKPGETIVLTGSIYLIGEAMARIQGARSNEGSRLQDKV